MARNGLTRRIRHDAFTDEERDVFVEWVIQMGMRRKSSEVAAFQLLAPMAYSESPLCHKLPSARFPIAFIYGEYDWVNRDIADELVRERKVQGEVFQTGDSGHHLYVEAAIECSSCLIKFVYGE